MNKLALVTGSTRGIGRAIGTALIKNGFRVIFTGRSQKELDSLYKLYGDSCIPLKMDFLKNDFINDLRDFFCQINAMPEVIVHNVGMRISSDMQPLSYKALMESIHINLGVAVEINSHFIPLMIEQNHEGGGDKRIIVHISSNSAIGGNGSPGYVAAKAGLNAYIKSTARYYAKDGLIINGIMPGIVEFEGGSWDKKLRDPQRYSEEIGKYPLGRFGRIEEIVEFIIFLCIARNQLSSGEIFTLSGGQ